MSYKQDFYNSVYNTAKELGATETQAHMAASQASLETGYGKHVAGNNYFGIKAGSSYTGPTVTTGTTEVYNGTPTSITDTFRQYQGLQDSVAGYMDFMGSRFADAWNSPDLSTAADNLMNGKYGAYATDPAYTDKIKGIANRFADAVDPTGFFSDGPAALSTSGPTTGNDTFGLLGPGYFPPAPVPAESIMSSWAGAQPQVNPFDALLAAPVTQAAIAPPVAPVQASASMSPMAAQPGASAAVEQLATPVKTTSVPNVATFDEGRFGPAAMPSLTDAGRLASGYQPNFGPAMADMSGLLSSQFNATASMGQPVTRGFEASASVPAITQSSTFADPAPSYDVTASIPQTGILGASAVANVENPGFWGDLVSLENQQTAAAGLSPASDAAAQAAMANYAPSFNAPVSASMSMPSAMPGATAAVGQIASAPVPAAVAMPNFSQAYNSAVNGMVSPTATEGFSVPSAIDSVGAQSITGPAQSSIPAQQYAAKPATRAAAPAAQPASEEGLIDKINKSFGLNLSKEGIGAGLLGGAFGGPVVGLLGALAGNYVAKNGGLGGLFSGLGQPISVNNIGGGYQNVQSVYGGRTDPGTQATASNGATVTSLPGGRVAYTRNGVTTVSNADGTGQGSYFGDTKF